MSYVAIGAVTKSIAELIGKKLNKPALMGGGTLKVTTLPPDDDRVDDNDGVNLFLYRVAEDPHLKNANWPGDKSHDAMRRPALSLNLYYLLTGYAKKQNGAGHDDVTAHQLLGNAMAILHEYPVLNDIHDADFDADVTTQFPQELRDSFQKIQITMLPNSMEEFSKIWTGLNKASRLSVIYEVSLVQIAPILPSSAVGPATQKISLDVSTLGPPALASMQPAVGPVGVPVVLKGKGFRSKGNPTSVMIDGRELTETDLIKVTDSEITFLLPKDPQRGPQLQISVVAGGRQSEAAIYQVEPWILSPQPLRGLTGVPITIPFQAPGGAVTAVEIDGKAAVFSVDTANNTVQATVPATITENGSKTVELVVNDGGPKLSNTRIFEVLPMIQNVVVTTSNAPDKTTITVTGQRLIGKDVNVTYDKLSIHKGENLSDTQIIVEVDRILPTTKPTSVLIDGRGSNVLPPKLDAIDPIQAFAGDEITLSGSGLSGQTVTVSFDATIVTVGPHAGASQLKVKVPLTLAAGPVGVKATINTKDTDALEFAVLG
jgi:hypothetical protein